LRERETERQRERERERERERNWFFFRLFKLKHFKGKKAKENFLIVDGAVFLCTSAYSGRCLREGDFGRNLGRKGETSASTFWGCFGDFQKCFRVLFRFFFFYVIELRWQADLIVPRQPNRSPVVTRSTE
jgi:hypothetical protein